MAVRRRPYRCGWSLAVVLTVVAATWRGPAAGEPVAAGGDAHWSLAPPRLCTLPPTARRDWPRERLDAFLLERLEALEREPSCDATRRTFARRVSYDLTGLPPTPEEIDAFVSDARPDAYERLVDRLLSRPAFGERWTSLWLNLARYAEDQAHQVGDDEKHFYPNAYRYRDWLIAAFNRDLPFDEFVRLQLAADKIEGVRRDGDLVALGFLGLGPKYYGRGSLAVKADEWEDRVDTVARTFLGLTVACARCHDHKYDPISMEDYYALAGVFASTKMVNRSLRDEPIKEKQKNNRPPPDTIHIVEDGEITDLNVFRRGNVDDKGPKVPRRFLAALSDREPERFERGSGRLELAEKIVDPKNPLTARVFVNRIWAECFGRPLVATRSNFGTLGAEPTHPRLLDDLAFRFVEGGWSLKRLLREIVLSAAYRQTSFAAEDAAVDPANVLLGRMARKRLSIEGWRDTLLAAGGSLEASIGGPSIDPGEPSGRRRTVYSRISRLQLDEFLRLFDYPDPNVHSSGRSVTTTPMQKLFVLNDPFVIEQARALAARLTRESRGGPGDTEVSRRSVIHRAYRVLFGREPSEDEYELGAAYLAGADGQGGASGESGEGLSRLERYAHVLLASSELLYVD